jgi:hypothetical protein
MKRIGVRSIGHRVIGLAVVVAMSFVSVLAAPPTPALATTRPIFGISSNLESLSTAERDKAFTMVGDAGANWIRAASYWPWIDRDGRANRDWSDPDGMVARAEAHNLKVVMTIDGYAAWANSSAGNWVVPADMSEFTNFARDTAVRYKGRVHYYEIWNEENSEYFWAPAANAAAYAKMLHDAYVAIKAVDPTAQVIVGGFSRNDWGFLSGVYKTMKAYPNAAANRYFFDYLGIHPYANNRPPESDDPAYITDTQDKNFAGLPKMKAAMDAQGDTGKHIICTEFGWAAEDCVYSKGVGETTQAAYLTRAYHMAQNWPWLDALMWWGFKNWDGDETQFSLVHTDLSPRPAYSAFSAAAHAETTVTPPPSGGTTVTPPPSGGTPTTSTTTTNTNTTVVLGRRGRGHKGSRVSLVASVAPRQAGKIVEFQKAVRGRWVTAKKARLNWRSRAVYSYRIWGSNRWRVRFAGSATAPPRTSRTVKVAVL